MPTNNLKAIISKIILFYSVFFVVMKIIAILFENAWPIPNLILAIPFLVFAIIGGLMLKKDTYSWIYVIAGILVISVLRYYEAAWMVSLHNYFS